MGSVGLIQKLWAYFITLYKCDPFLAKKKDKKIYVVHLIVLKTGSFLIVILYIYIKLYISQQ